MMQETDTAGKQDERQHLALVHSLARELESARGALVKNNLAQFNAHVAQQEAICRQLANTPWIRRRADSEETTSKIRQAYQTLAQQNRIYAAVLRRWKRTNDLLAALYRCQQGYGNAVGAASKLETWSCEG
jgi:hypothetical protein